jgi:carboxypeptidase-like protein
MAGTVRDDSTNRPLAGVEVVVERSKRLAVTDNAGRYVLMGLPTGTRVALFRFVGYRPVRLRVELSKTDTLRADARMVREALQRLEPVVVTGQPAAPRGLGSEAFEERRRLGFGIFIDSAELRRSEGIHLPDLLRRHNVEILRMQDPRVPSPRMIYVAVSKGQGRGLPGERCLLQVILDGAVMANTEIGPLDLSTFDIAGLGAVEVYRSAAGTPVEFAGAGSDCGSLIMWSRKR